MLISLPKAHWFECLGSARKVQSCVGSGTTTANLNRTGRKPNVTKTDVKVFCTSCLNLSNFSLSLNVCVRLSIEGFSGTVYIIIDII